MTQLLLLVFVLGLLGCTRDTPAQADARAEAARQEQEGLTKTFRPRYNQKNEPERK